MNVSLPGKERKPRLGAPRKGSQDPDLRLSTEIVVINQPWQVQPLSVAAVRRWPLHECKLMHTTRGQVFVAGHNSKLLRGAQTEFESDPAFKHAGGGKVS